MKDFLAKCKNMFSKSEKPARRRDVEQLMEHVDKQIGRAIQRLGER